MIPSFIARLLQYPKSYQALRTGQADQLSPWLTYWTVLGVFQVAEGVGDSLIWWIPFYDEFKIIIVLCLVFPNGQGASQLYQSYIRPFFTRHESQIESIIFSGLRRIQAGCIWLSGYAQRQNYYLWPMQNGGPVMPVSEFENISSDEDSN